MEIIISPLVTTLDKFDFDVPPAQGMSRSNAHLRHLANSSCQSYTKFGRSGVSARPFRSTGACVCIGVDLHINCRENPGFLAPLGEAHLILVSQFLRGWIVDPTHNPPPLSGLGTGRGLPKEYPQAELIKVMQKKKILS